jgi:hypothetical protein
MHDNLCQANPSLSQLRLVPKGWARGQLSLREFDYKRLQVLQSYKYSTTKIQVLTTMKIRYYNNYEQIYKIDKIQIIKIDQVLKCEN